MEGEEITGTVADDQSQAVTIETTDDRLTGGGVALLCEEGPTATERVDLHPLA